MVYLMNEQSTLTTDMMCGLRSAYPGLFIDPSKHLLLLNRDRSHRVALLAGSGAGHEPYGFGFVGENLLTGYISGPVFDSPPIGSIIAAIYHLAEWNQGGVLVLVENSPCNRLSFGVAVERARNRGIKVENVFIQDDCSLSGAVNVLDEKISNRSTLSGAAIYFKILGGLSSSGRCMEELLWEEKLLCSRTASASVCYSPCTIPGKTQMYYLKKGQVSLGVGINGSGGGVYTFENRPIDEVIHILVQRLLLRCLITSKGSVVALVNNLGCLTTMECYQIGNCVTKELVGRGIEVARLYVGTVLTSLDTAGFSLTLTNVTEKEIWLDQLDLETEAPAWPGSKLSRPNTRWPQREFIHDIQDITQICGSELDHSEINDLKNSILAVCKSLMANKDLLNHLCAGTGVYLGSEMNRFAEGTLGKLKQSCTFLKSLPNTFLVLGAIAEETMSTSAAGSIYSLLLLGAAQGSGGTWTEVWESAVNTLSKYTSAKIGHRSLIDSLIPACGVFRRILARDGPQAWRGALKAAVETAEESCADTRTMVSKSMMSPFFKMRSDTEEAGARAVVIVLRAIFATLCPNMEKPGIKRRDRRVSSITYGTERTSRED